MADDIVITGMGVVSPIGCDEQRFWRSLCKGAPGTSTVDGLDTTQLPRAIACQVREPFVSDAFGGRASQLAVAAGKQAIADASLVNQVDPHRIFVVVGTTMGETEFIEERLTAPADDWLTTEHVQRIVSGRPGSIAANVAQSLKADCPALDLYGACAAGNMALAYARRQLLAGRCDVALAGGADGFSRLAFLGFMRLRIMAAGVCRPFDERRDGLLVGEGAGMFVLERESSAKARGARIRARLAGCGGSCETYHPTRPDPEGDGLLRSTQAALADAVVSPEDVDYVCAHGTGTPHNDAVEVAVMERLFRRGVAFSSIKALTGHTMGAAAALEASCCVLSLEHQVLIPTWNLEQVLQPCSLDAVRDGVRPAKLGCLLNNSAGFGGYNSSVILCAA